MATSSSIEWTDATWNPTTGCSRVSAGCDLCYAMTMARRFDGLGNGYDGTTRRTPRGTDWTGVVHLHEDRLQQPLSWRKPRLVFVDSMSDLFHPKVGLEFIDKVFAVMALASNHVFQILTKRPERMAEYTAPGAEALSKRWMEAMDAVAGTTLEPDYPLENVWLGTSVENESAAGRINELRSVDASVRFLSMEPLIGAVKTLDLEGIHWVIVGGESGNGFREMKEEWVLDIKECCEESSVPFFFKQWGGRHSKDRGRKLLGQTWDEMPESASVVLSA